MKQADELLLARSIMGRYDPSTDEYKCARALVASLSSPSVPETHVIVPKEATEAMQSAYFDSIDKYLPRVQTDPLFGRYKNFRIAYRAMLTAAQPPSAPPEAGKVQK
jgi:hypothetical protein